MKRFLERTLSWVLALSITLSIIPAFDVTAVAAEISEEVSALATEIQDTLEQQEPVPEDIDSEEEPEEVLRVETPESGTYSEVLDEYFSDSIDVIHDVDAVFEARRVDLADQFKLTSAQVASAENLHGSLEAFSTELTILQ